MFSHSGHVMTLANSIIGVGILAMPFCFQKCGIILSILLIIISNWITRICCHYLIKTSLLTRRKSFEFLGFHAFGPSGKLLVELFIIGYLLGTCITYFVVVGDLGPQIITKMFALEDGHVHLRTLIMIAVTLICILPLGMLKNVDSLSTVFTASIGFYVCLVLKIVLESEEHIVANDWTQKVVYWEPAGVLQCLPIFSMALSCQMQLFEVFGSVNNQSLEKLNGIVRNATWICTFVYIAVGFFGYVAFCTQAFSGNILMNFSPTFSSDVIKIGFILSVAFSFPLVIFPCRASIYSLLYRKGHTDATAYIPDSRFKLITVFIVAFALCVALMIPSVELIIGLVGSTIGVAICIMFPASCFRKIVKKESTERALAQFILVGGFCLMILGTFANLSAIDEKRSGAHLDNPDDLAILIKPTQLPFVLNQEKLEQLEDQLKINDFKKVADSANSNAKLINIEKNIVVPKKEPLQQHVEIAQSPEPLPVDEKHVEPPPKVENIEKQEKPDEKLQAISPVPKEVVEIVPLDLVKISNIKEVPALLVDIPIKKEIKNVTQQQSIDQDAIKKDEDIAAEELKLANKAAKEKDDELKKTKNELKETLAAFNELKKEIVKQNEETQNEKLDEVEKVEEIVIKVQQNAQQNDISRPLVDTVNINDKKLLEPAQPLNKGSLLSILTETAFTKNDTKAPVYEPLSYKTGELIEHVRNDSQLDQRLPLPLALLINASQSKINESLSEQKKDTIEQLKTVNKSKDDELKIQKPLTIEKNLSANKVTSKIAKTVEETDKENVASIRRDILQYNAAKQTDEMDTTQMPPNAQASLQRVKRSNFEAINVKLEDCLTQPKVETLMAQSLSNAIGFEMKNVGRDLKSLTEEDNK